MPRTKLDHQAPLSPSSADTPSLEGNLPRLEGVSRSTGARYKSIEDAVAGLSRVVGREVNEQVVRTMFATDREGGVGLPPIPRRDSELCAHVASMVQIINLPLGATTRATTFLNEMFAGAAGRILNSYELDLLEFAVAHKGTIEIVFEPLTRRHVQESPASGEERVIFGIRHHLRNRDYTAVEAFSTFMHELAHARESVFDIVERSGPPQVILSEVHANTFGNGGKIGAAIALTSQLYQKSFQELKAYMPGFDSLDYLDRYNYIAIMAKNFSAPITGLIYEEDTLIEAFPQLESEIRRAVQRAKPFFEAMPDL